MVNCRDITRGSKDLAKHTTLELVMKMRANDNQARLPGQTALNQLVSYTLWNVSRIGSETVLGSINICRFSADARFSTLRLVVVVTGDIVEY